MGALSGKKRGDDYFKSVVCSGSPPIDHSYGRISKKPRFSPSVNQGTPSYNSHSSSSVSRVALYPVLDRKQGPRREVHAPVRHSRFDCKKIEVSGSCEESSADRMRGYKGFLFFNYNYAMNAAVNSLRYHKKENEWSIGRKRKEKEVIEVDDVPDDSSVEDVEMMDVGGSEQKGRERGVVNLEEQHFKTVEKEPRSFDSSVITNVSNANGKVDDVENMDLMLVDKTPDDSGVPVYKRLLDSIMKSDAKLSSLKFNIEINEKRIGFLRSLWPKKKEEPAKKDVSEECFVPLTEEEKDQVCRALSNSNRRKVLVTHQSSNIDISGEKLQCLSPRAWLNDEVINLYLELLKEREKREPQKFLKCHFFNTFFYKKLISGKGGYNFQSVRRWTTQRKLGYSLSECDKIFVPIHQEIHWCLAIINKKEKKFQYLDSLRGIDSQVLNVLARYFVDEVKDKCGQDIDVSSWEQEYVSDLPEQANGYDCGMFMVKYADFYSRDIGLCFHQKHMQYFRQRTAKEILQLRAD